MNTYMYAPKHDDKHRHNWRAKYELDELKNLKNLIETSKQNGVDFVFSMAPGLDLRYSCNIDLEQLLNKFMDIRDLGCQSFAILFDDINEDLSPEDCRNFEVRRTRRLLLLISSSRSSDQSNIFFSAQQAFCWKTFGSRRVDSRCAHKSKLPVRLQLRRNALARLVAPLFFARTHRLIFNSSAAKTIHSLVRRRKNKLRGRT